MSDEPREVTDAAMVRDAVQAVLAFAKHAPDISRTLALQLGIVCGAAMKAYPKDDPAKG